MQSSPIASFDANSLSIRGISISDLIAHASYVEVLILTLTGKIPQPLDPRVQMINALLVAWVDHGEPPPSTQNVRNCASVGVPFVQAAASGFMAFGAAHGPVEEAASIIKRTHEKGVECLYAEVEMGYKIPGFGHPVHKLDPRMCALLELASHIGIVGPNLQAAHAIERCFHDYGKDVRLNLAGATAAIWLDMGFSASTVGLIALAGRSVGMAAHYEQQLSQPQFKGTP